MKTTSKWQKKFKLQNGSFKNSKIINLWMLKFCGFIIFTYKLRLRTFKNKVERHLQGFIAHPNWIAFDPSFLDFNGC